MQLDWFTWIAQIVNFLILVGLLRYFLYGRIVNAIDEREQKITSRFKEAGDKEEKARQEVESYQQKSDELEQKKIEILNAAKEDAEQQKKELVRKSRQEVDRLEKEWRDSLDQEKERFFNDLRKKVCNQVKEISHRFLKELADTQLESHLLHCFVQKASQQDHKDELKELLKQGQVNVLCSFKLKEQDQKKLADALEDIHGKAINMKFEQSPELICGLRLQSDGQQIDWSVQSYLDELEEQFSDYFSSKQENQDNS